ncbi:MAG: P-II family nitrogen regulator [Verrucomicrobiota bacterium]
MKVFHNRHGYCLVTAILPRHSTHRVLEEVLESGAAYAFTINARGSLIKNRWYQSFFPTLSPEQEILNFMLPLSDADHLMEQIVMAGNLRNYGAGSIFAVQFNELICAEDYPLWEAGKYTYESTSYDIRFKKNLVAIHHIAQKEDTDAITRAAIHAGAQGLTISFMRGIGIRDRLGLLRVTKNHEKELITVVVDEYDVDAIFQAMAQAGHVDQAGRGFVYQMPICKGLTNLSSVFHPEKHSASIQQIVRAIDEIQGNTHWRANQLLIHDPKASEFKDDNRHTIKKAVALGAVCHRKDTEMLLDKALEFGVPGASVGNWRLAEAKAKCTEGGLRMNREFSCIMMILDAEVIDPLRDVLQEVISDSGMKETCFFTIPAPIAKTFVSPSSERAKK